MAHKQLLLWNYASPCKIKAKNIKIPIEYDYRDSSYPYPNLTLITCSKCKPVLRNMTAYFSAAAPKAPYSIQPANRNNVLAAARISRSLLQCRRPEAPDNSCLPYCRPTNSSCIILRWHYCHIQTAWFTRIALFAQCWQSLEQALHTIP